MSSTGDIQAVSCYGPSAASTRVRQDDWFRFLGVRPIYHYYAELNNNRPSTMLWHAARVARAEFSLRRLDLTDQRVVLSREASPFSRGNVEERLLRSASRGVYDFDDALFDDPSSIRERLGTQDKYRRSTAAADVVIAGNDYLANWAAPHNKDIRVIPSCINPRDYIPKTDWSITGNVPVLVWLGSPSTERYLAHVAPALLELHRCTGATLTIVSGPGHNPILDPLNAMIRRVPWRIETFASHLRSADIAIAPLDDEAYSRGKCAYKLLQYAAACLPIIGSPVGANQLALRRFDGLEVRSLDEWYQGIFQIVAEPASKRADRGLAARTAVKAHYSFNAWKSKWCDATGVTEADR